MNALCAACLRFAAWLLRRDHAEWARAMRSEIRHIDRRERTAWALGCVIAAIRYRWAPMNTGDLRISRWVMLVETVGGFGPLALSWYLMVFDQPGIIHYSLTDIQRWYLPQDGGAWAISMMYAAAIVGLIGPIGLYLGLRYAVSGRALDNRMLGAVLIGAPITLAIVGCITGKLFGPADFRLPLDGVTFVFLCVPVAVLVHLRYLARPSAAPPALASA